MHKPNPFQIDTEMKQKALSDFMKHFGNGQEPEIKEDVLNGESVIVIESAHKKTYYSANAELIKVFNLRGED